MTSHSINGGQELELLEVPSVSHSNGSGPEEVIPAQCSENTVEPVIDLSCRRWLILAAYSSITVSNLSTNFATASISNILQKYYGKNSMAIDWLAIVYAFVSIMLMFPFSQLVDKMGLSSALVTAGFFNSLGSCIRYIGSFNRQYGYWFFFAGNFCCAAATSAFLFLPSKVAAVWFGSKERAKATSIAIAADSFGLALGYIQPPLMVANHKNIDDIGKDLSTYQLTVAVQSVMTFIFICSVIQDKPKIPPSESEAAKNKSCLHTRSHISFAFIKRYMNVLKNCSFHVILHVHGLLFATERIWLIVLNEILIPRFQGHEVVIGSMGMAGLIASMFSNVLIGTVLDRTNAYRITTLVTTSSTFLLVGLFATLFQLTNSFIAFYIIYVFVVIIFTTYYTTSFEHCAEVTYPISEADSGVTLLWFGQLYSLILAQFASLINHHFSSTWVVYYLVALYFLAFILSLAVKNKGSRTNYLSSIINSEYVMTQKKYYMLLMLSCLIYEQTMKQ